MYPVYPYAFDPWTWRDPQLWGVHERERTEAEADRERVHDLSGYRVEALDGSVGTVDKASYDTNDSWLVVDTGPWILGRKVLLPAGTVQHINHDERTMYVDRDRAQIENSPGYDPDTFSQPEYRERVGRYYDDSYQERPTSR